MVDVKVSVILESFKYAGELSAILTEIVKNIHSEEMDINKIDGYISKIPDYYAISTKAATSSVVNEIENMLRGIGIKKFRYLKILLEKDTDIKFGIIYDQLIAAGVDKKDLDMIMRKSIDYFVDFLINIVVISINYLMPKYPIVPNYGGMGMYDGDIFRVDNSIFNWPITSNFNATLSNNHSKTASSPLNTIPFSKPYNAANAENTPIYNPFIRSYEYFDETDLDRYLDPVHRIMDDDDDDDDDEDRWVKSSLFRK